jgi:hypothetical protein
MRHGAREPERLDDALAEGCHPQLNLQRPQRLGERLTHRTGPEDRSDRLVHVSGRRYWTALQHPQAADVVESPFDVLRTAEDLLGTTGHPGQPVKPPSAEDRGAGLLEHVATSTDQVTSGSNRPANERFGAAWHGLDDQPPAVTCDWVDAEEHAGAGGRQLLLDENRHGGDSGARQAPVRGGLQYGGVGALKGRPTLVAEDRAELSRHRRCGGVLDGG